MKNVEEIYYRAEDQKPIFARILKENGEKRLVPLTDDVQLSIDSMVSGCKSGFNKFNGLTELQGLNYETKTYNNQHDVIDAVKVINFGKTDYGQEKGIAFYGKQSEDIVSDFLNNGQQLESIVFPITAGKLGGHTVYYAAIKQSDGSYIPYILNQTSKMDTDRVSELTKVTDDIKEALQDKGLQVGNLQIINGFLEAKNGQAACAETGMKLFEALNESPEALQKLINEQN